ncbi:MAG: pentapeptide repeat-containing protein [Pseudomonadota bacterium]
MEEDVLAGRDAAPPPGLGGGMTAALGVLIFGFGAAAGFMFAFTGLGFADNIADIFVIVLGSVMIFLAVFGLLFFVFRKRIFRRVFGFAEARLEMFASPLQGVAQGAIDRDPQAATTAARELVQISLARFAWISTRRWIIGSLTALIAAMAALAGTALLFEQNKLLGVQNERIDTQIAQAEEQTLLANYTVQLAEAARNAQLVVEITDIAAELGRALDDQGNGDGTVIGAIPVLNPLELDRGLVMRVSSASRATKPYRFLEVGTVAGDDVAANWVAMQRRKDDLPQTLAAIAETFDLDPISDKVRLVDRPASPERGQLLLSLLQAGVRETEVLTFFGTDFSFAFAPEIDLFATSFQLARLSYADFSHAEVREGDFGGAFLSNVRFRHADLFGTSFSSILGESVKPPFSTDTDVYNTSIIGADFSGAMLTGVSFLGVNGNAMNFDGATLVGTDFSFALIPATTFREAVIVNATWEGADLRSVDFDGALVVGADFLGRVGEAAAPGTFRADRFELEEVEVSAFADVTSFLRFHDDVDALVGDRGVYRVRRVAPFEE